MGTRFLSKDERNTFTPNLSGFGKKIYFATNPHHVQYLHLNDAASY